MTTTVEQVGTWLAHFTRQQPAAAWLCPLRETAFELFSALGFPTVRDENWRFTNVAPIAQTTFEPAPPAIVDVRVFAPFATGTRLVFINGRLQRTASPLPEGVVAGPLSEDARPHLARYADFESNAFVALNTAFLNEVACIRIAPGTIVERPIHLVYITASGTQPSVTHPRALVLAGAGAKCTVVETYAGSGSYFTNAVTEIVAGESTTLEHYKIQLESPGAFHVGTLQAELGRDARYTTHSISLGGALVRNDSIARLAQGTEATLNGLYLAKGTQHIDNQLTVDHAQPNASSHQLYKGILDGRATAGFNGRILVRKDAQKTDARQTNQNLILSDQAVMNTKPELRILADDVRCTHGATVGQLDAEALFYLQSRGIGKSEARNLLTYAFAQDVIHRVKVQDLRDSLERALDEKFHDHGK